MKNRYPDDQWQEIIGACDSQVFLGCTDELTSTYISDKTGSATVVVEGTMRELNSMRITNYTPQFRETNSIGKRMLMTPDEVLRLKPDEELIFIRGQKVLKAHRFDYSQHPDYKRLRDCKAIDHLPTWRESGRASSISGSNDPQKLSTQQPMPTPKKPPEKKQPIVVPDAKQVDLNDIF